MGHSEAHIFRTGARGTLGQVFGYHADYAPFQTHFRRDVDLCDVAVKLKRIERTALIRQSTQILYDAFGDSRRESGTLNVRHAQAVARGSVLLAMRDGCSEEELIQQYACGQHHDTFEDRPQFKKDVKGLVSDGLQPATIKSVGILTKRPGEKRFDSTTRVMKDRMASRAKTPDHVHNSSLIEQMAHLAYGKPIRGGHRAYNISASALLAVLEGRVSPHVGVEGYLFDIGRDIMIPANRRTFRENFADSSNVMKYLDGRHHLLPQHLQETLGNSTWKKRTLLETVNVNPDRSIGI